MSHSHILLLPAVLYDGFPRPMCLYPDLGEYGGMLVFTARDARPLRDYDVFHVGAEHDMGPHCSSLQRIGTVGGGLYEQLAFMWVSERDYEKAFGDCFTSIYYVSGRKDLVDVYARAAPLARQKGSFKYRHYSMVLVDGSYAVTPGELVDSETVQELRAAASMRPLTARL